MFLFIFLLYFTFPLRIIRNYVLHKNRITCHTKQQTENTNKSDKIIIEQQEKVFRKVLLSLLDYWTLNSLLDCLLLF